MQEAKTSKKEVLLKGRENYLAWSTRMETMLRLDDGIKRNEYDKIIVSGKTDKDKEQNERTAMRYAINNLLDINGRACQGQMVQSGLITYDLGTAGRFITRFNSSH